MTDPSQQTSIAGFTTFVRNVMRVAQAYLPDDSPYLTWMYDQALNIVNQDLACLPYQKGAWSLYAQAAYNLGGALLAEFAPDQSWPVAAASWANFLATIQTTVPNTLSPGDRVLISGISPLAYDQPPAPNRGPFQVNAIVDPTHFTYALSPNPGVASIGANAVVSMTFFSALRTQLKMNAFFPGMVQGAGDQGTSASFDSPEFFKGLSLYDLQLMKSPWGRSYLALAQKAGPAVWGIN